MPPTRPLRTLLRLLPAVLLAVWALAGCGADGAPEAPARAGDASLPAPEFGERVLDPDVVLIDVRTPEEYAAGHIEGARNLPLGSPDFDRQVEALDRDRTYAVYCRTDTRSGEALQVMAEHGVTDAFDLEGGMDAWQEHGGTVVTSPR